MQKMQTEKTDPITVRIYCDEKGKCLLRALLPDHGDFGAVGAVQISLPFDWSKASERAYVLWGDVDNGVVYADVFGGVEDFAEHVRQVLQKLADEGE